MTSIVYINGLYTPHRYGMVHINDRCYQFADAAYEVVLYINGFACDEDLHLDRLDRTLEALKINFSMSRRALKMNMQTLLAKNKITTGTIYIQVSRGVAPRNHPFPKDNISPVLVMTTKPVRYDDLLKTRDKKLSLTLRPDYRWGRCDLKTTGLLPNVLSMQEAIDSGFDDALFYDNQGITEGTSWNFWIVNNKRELQTRPLSNQILHGITRQTISEIAKEQNLKYVENPITKDDLYQATEAFATSATKIAMPIKNVDEITFPPDTPVTHALFDAYLKRMFG